LQHEQKSMSANFDGEHDERLFQASALPAAKRA